MSIRSLSYFLAVAEELNITTAAQKLYITQQTLSSHIKRLEDQYGVMLFERRPKLKLTPAGERMVHYATRIVRLERMMNAEFVDLSKKNGGVLMVGCSRVRAKYFLPRVWHAYQQLCPNIEIRLTESLSHSMDDHILSRKVDMSIGLNASSKLNIFKEWLLAESLFFLISTSLFEEYFGKASEHILRQFQSGIDCNEIVGIPLILQPSSNYIRQIINQQFELLDVVPRTLFETNDSEMILNMCLTNCGGAILPESAVFVPTGTSNQNLDDVYIFPIKNVKVSTVISYPTDLAIPHYEQLFVDVCKDVFEESRCEMDRQKNVYFNNLKHRLAQL